MHKYIDVIDTSCLTIVSYHNINYYADAIYSDRPNYVVKKRQTCGHECECFTTDGILQVKLK